MTNNALKSVTLIKVIQPESIKISITSDHVLILSLGISGIAFFLHFVFEYALSGFLALLATLFLPVSIITTIWGWNEYYPDKYNINGLISLSHLEISIDKEKYLLKELNNLKFHVNEFKGLRLRYPQLFPAGPCLSQGIILTIFT